MDVVAKRTGVAAILVGLVGGATQSALPPVAYDFSDMPVSAVYILSEYPRASEDRWRR